MNNVPVLLTVFLATTSLLVATWLFFNRRRLTAAEAARERLKQAQEQPLQRRASVSILKTERTDTLSALGALLRTRWIGDRLERLLVHAGSDVTPPVFLLVSISCFLIALAIALVLRRPVMALVLPPIAGLLPLFYFRRRASRRLMAFQAQLPDAIDMLVSAMKAGYSFQAAMNFIGQEVPEPLGPEFSRFYDEQRLGVDVRTALLGMQERIDSMDLKMFTTAVLVQRDSGGTLSEVLANISDIMRDRFALEGEIESLTAESRVSARILAGLPVVVLLGISLMNPTFMQPMWTQAVGQAMIGLAAISVMIGYFIMMKIADIDV
jgi:tight adherence protein B